MHPLTIEQAAERLRTPSGGRRVLVAGSSGVGKTTLSRTLASSAGVPHVQLDALFWGPEWTPAPGFRERVAAELEQPEWILDGNYSGLRELYWPRLDLVVWLDLPIHLALTRVALRSLRRVWTGERLYAGNRETLRRTLSGDGMPAWVWRTHGKRRRQYERLLVHDDDGPVFVRLQSPGAVARFVSAVTRGSSISPGNEELR